MTKAAKAEIKISATISLDSTVDGNTASSTTWSQDPSYVATH